MTGTSSPVGVVLLYSQDTRGLGHITRTLTIAHHVLETFEHLVAYIVTRSKIVREVAWPHRCDYIRLPSRRTPKLVVRSPEDEEASIEQFRALRSQILRDVALGLAPDYVIVDHEPLGSSGEFRDGLWALKERRPDTKFFFGLRDIMDDPDRIRQQWRELGVYDALEHLYDGIAVFGSPRLYDVAEAYAIPDSVRPKLHYCGYVVRDFPPGELRGLRRAHGLPEDGRLVLAAVGSGRDGFPVLQRAADAIARLQQRHPDVCAILVTGPFMPEEEAESMLSLSGPRTRVVPYADTFQLMAACDAAICMGGYNTVCEGLMTACPMVIVPRATHKVEQLIRAELLATHDLARYVHPDEANESNLVEGLEWALGRDRRAQARRVREVFPSFDGAAELTGYLSKWMTGGPREPNPSVLPSRPSVPIPSKAVRAAVTRLEQPGNALDVVRTCLDDDFQAESAGCEVLRAHPDRFVMQVRARAASGNERTYALKVYLHDFGEKMWELGRQVGAHYPPHLDGPILPIRYVPKWRALVFPWIEGKRMSEVVDERKPEMLRRAARLAANLHRTPVDGVPPLTPGMVVADALDRCQRLRYRWPSMAPTIDRLMLALQQAAAARDPAEPALIHGDLAASQFLWTGERLVLLDLDMAAWGDPAYDVGHFLGQLDRRCAVDSSVSAHAQEWLSSVRETYFAAMPGVSRRNASLYQGITLVRKMHTLCQRDPVKGQRLAARLAERAYAAFEAVGPSTDGRPERRMPSPAEGAAVR